MIVTIEYYYYYFFKKDNRILLSFQWKIKKKRKLEKPKHEGKMWTSHGFRQRKREREREKKRKRNQRKL